MTGPAGSIGAVAAHQWQREQHEHYVEPEWVSDRLFVEERFDGGIWDPACGFGRIPKAAERAGLPTEASDLVDRGHGYRLDFLTSEARFANIVTNPPFNIAPEFAQHALKLAWRKVAMIFPTARLNAAHWLTPTPLRRVLLITPRPSMPPGEVITRGQKPQGGKMDFCWLVWERGYAGVAEIGWLRRKA